MICNSYLIFMPDGLSNCPSASPPSSSWSPWLYYWKDKYVWPLQGCWWSPCTPCCKDWKTGLFHGYIQYKSYMHLNISRVPWRTWYLRTARNGISVEFEISRGDPVGNIGDESEIADHPFLMTSFTPYGWVVCFWAMIIAFQVSFPSNLYWYTNYLGSRSR